MKRVQAVVGWTILSAFVILALLNFQQAKISMLDVSLVAPLSYIIGLSALFGALSRRAIVKAIGWAVRRTKPDMTPVPMTAHEGDEEPVVS